MVRRERKTPAGRKSPTPRAVGLRIVGGRFRGRRLQYYGDRRVRPMKDRVREAVFNLIGPSVADKHALDLFGGTGALGLEAVSRGAAGAIFLEQHHPTAKMLRENIAALGIQDGSEVIVADAFAWFRRGPELPAVPWIVFVSPPYDFFVARRDDMLELISGLLAAAPAGSVFVVESDERFDPAELPDAQRWDIRPYPPAVVAVYRKP